jgi:hypothetical protein
MIVLMVEDEAEVMAEDLVEDLCLCLVVEVDVAEEGIIQSVLVQTPALRQQRKRKMSPIPLQM